MEMANELFGKFKTEIILWLVFYAMYLPLSILIWLKTGRPTNVTIAGIMTVGTICVGTFTFLRKAQKAKLGIPKKREVRHPEMERIPVSSFTDNIPLIGKSLQKTENIEQPSEVKHETETYVDNMPDVEPDSTAPIGAS